LSYQGHNVHAAGDASNSLIQVSIVRLALSIFSCVGIPWITLESAIPTLIRASFNAPPRDRFKTAAYFALLSVATTIALGDVVNRKSIAAFAASNSSLMWTM
jgi:hypothetical protein